MLSTILRSFGVAALLGGVIILASFMITFLATEYGFQAGTRRRLKLSGKEEDISPGPFSKAALGLLSFMLAMAYGTAQSRLHDLKQVALDEANSIGTAYLRADLLPGADRAQVRQLLRDYVTLRIETVEAGAKQPVEQAIDKSEKLRKALWSIAATLADQESTYSSRLLVESVTQLIELHNARITLALRYRLPELTWLVLYGLAFLAMAMGGYANGYSGALRSVSLALAMASAYSVVLMLVVGLDRTEKHLSTVTQSAMLDLQEQISRSISSKP